LAENKTGNWAGRSGKLDHVGGAVTVLTDNVVKLLRPKVEFRIIL
jgi:hypothetical protein